METNTDERKKNCPRCGAGFGCCTNNCWCSELPNIMPLVDNEDCLCYDCLKAEIEKKSQVQWKM
ncbi:hypothetical protein [uncultured Mucilaginibacter sp.]|uniref:hypothetical protein n=1 Tax=uncultured Mucilaginibacter sp. TaxID=797541 RepID=UPI0025CD4A98|nr:hypothetical protein [uncultured Mucilaginibacter sp.]